MVWIVPGDVFAQTIAAIAAIISSAIIPAAPTMTRYHFCLKAHALVASIYGSGKKTKNIPAIQWTTQLNSQMGVSPKAAIIAPPRASESAREIIQAELLSRVRHVFAA